MQEEEGKRKLAYLIIILALAALLLAIFAPNVLGQSDTDGLLAAFQQCKASNDACIMATAKDSQGIVAIQNQCQASYDRINRLADGQKNLIVSALFTSAVLNALLLYMLLKVRFKGRSLV